jgi:alpha-amylase/alpha-mannosidase (GH57 family)
MEGKIALAFLWHQHQPYYPDDVAGENAMPWVRLHGVKDYYGMALHLREFPEMRCTINLVPSLILQLQRYTEGHLSDRHLDVSRIPADGLSEADCIFLLDQFFMANPDRMIRPFLRYHELYQRRALGKNTAREALRRFSERDFRDLQVWFNLAWVHPLAVERDDLLRSLVHKNRNFTEAEKSQLLDKHLEILKQIIPLHMGLAATGQVELTTTPYYHPILPLVLDKKLAREAMPDVKLPRASAGYPDDAALQVRRAVEQHTRIFGSAPRGMWPAEGSVCQSMIPLLAQHGVKWIATDEEILNRSTHGFVSRDAKGFVRNPDRMYRPYKVGEGGHELGIVFRDHALSDMIGFHYQRSEPVAAADDFIAHVQAIGEAVQGSGQPPLVSVILDGENCWEHYPDGGVPFLRALYERCCKSPDIEPVAIGPYLERQPPRDTLPHLFAGSWISHNFAIWVGHEEDNTAWDALHKTREHLRQRSNLLGAEDDKVTRWQGDKVPQNRDPSGVTLSPGHLVTLSPMSSGQPVTLSPIERAWEEIYIAEGSDWFWWYGDDHSSAQDALFDSLFRKHLQNVYLLLGDAPPPELAQAISRKGQRAIHSLPRAFLSAKIDGRKTFFEWVNAGHYTCQNERGTMAMATHGPIKELYFGFNVRALMIRIDCDGPAKKALADFDQLRIGFLEPADTELLITPADAKRAPGFQLRRSGQNIGAAGVEVGIDQIAEMAIPFERLGVKVGEPVQFYVELLQDDQSRDRAPREGAISLTCPSPDFERIMWDV